MKNTQTKPYRQGDVLIRPTEKTVGQNLRVLSKNERHVLAFGEATGHAHEILDRDAVTAFVATDGTEITEMEIHRAVELVHQDHGTIELPAGNYEVIHQRVYTPQEVRRVAD